MKKKKIVSNSFVEGTIITTMLLIFIKILGAVYVIPFYKIIGPYGGTLYSYAYNIYNLFLNVSTAGIPIAMSMIISEYLALNMYDAKERAYKKGKYLICILAVVSFLLVFFGSGALAKFILSDVTGGHTVSEVSNVIKAISFCLLIIPFLSILRGYMQGHKFVVPTSIAQVIEQIVRIAILLLGSYVSIKVLKMDISKGVSIALLGTFFGGLAAYIYLRKKVSDNTSSFPKAETKDRVSNKLITKKIITYCIPIVLIAITDSLYNLVDIKFIIKGLNMVGYSAIESETISGIVATWVPKICTIMITISLALTTNIIPHVTTSFIQKDMKTVKYKINQAISTMIIMAIPMTLLLMVLSKEAFYIFYGNNSYGPTILTFSAVSHLLLGVWTMLNATLQSMRKFKEIYINSLTGVLVNAVLDIPLILLFSKIGIPAYTATIVSSCIGYSTSIILTLRFLKKDIDMDYTNTLNILKKIILPCIIMIMPILVGKYFIKVNITFISSFISCGIYGSIGMLIYLFVAYKNKSLLLTFGEDFINKILIKLKLKK